VDIALNTEPTNIEQSKICINQIYKNTGLETPKTFLVVDSPLLKFEQDYSIYDQVSNKIFNQINTQVWNQINDQIFNQINTQVWNQINTQVMYQAYDQVSDQVWNQINNQVYTQINNQLRNPVRNQVRDQVWNQISNKVSDQVRDQVWNKVKNHLNSTLFGYHNCCLSYYDFLLNELKINCVEPMKPFIELAKCCGWWIPYQNHVVLQHRFQEVHRNSNGDLHNEHGMSIKYRDGWGFYSLNGVTVPEWMVLKKPEDIDPKELMKIDNAQIRTEFVRKVGIDRCFYKLGKVIDKFGDYELGLLELGDGRKRPYLKMKNPSVPDLWHVEGVHPSCLTVSSALTWRNGTSERPEILT